MRQAVLTGGLDTAAEAFQLAHEVATLCAAAASRRLAPLAGMAGDDSTSAEFAGAYDAGAAEAVGALAEVAGAYATMTRLTRETVHLHRAAERATSDGVAVDTDAMPSVPPPRVSSEPPPSSLGPGLEGLGEVQRWILGHLEGFAWPGADTDRLRLAADVWRTAAADTVRLADRCDLAVSLFEEQRSAEFPLAVAATVELRGLATDTAARCADLAEACDDYADAVESARDRTRALLAEVAQMVVEGVAVSALVGFVTAGTATGAAVSAAAARIAAQSPRFHAVLASLRVSTAGVGSKARTARAGLADTRSRMQKFLRAPARDERGSMTLGGVAGRPRGWLRTHEVPPGHTLSEHVGKSVEELFARCQDLNRGRASTFSDQDTAEELVSKTLDHFDEQVTRWVDSGSTDKLVLQHELGTPTGTTVAATGRVTHPTGVKVVLIPSSRSRDGWQLLTAYPN